MPVRVRTLIVSMSLLVACGYDEEQGRDRVDVPEDVATVLDHELAPGTLWVSEAGDPERAAEEFLEQVLGWSIEVARFTGHEDDELDELFDDPDVDLRRRIGLEAESPDGRPVGLWVRAGEPASPEVEPEDPADDRWRVRLVGVDQPYGLTLDEDMVLGVHEIPEQQGQSVLLLYVDDATEAFLLDDGELEPGAEADDLDLSALGVDSERPVTTGLAVHFDDDGRTLSAEGGSISQPRPAAAEDEDDLPEAEPVE